MFSKYLFIYLLNSTAITSINLTEKVGTVDIFLNYSLDFSDLKLASVVVIRVGECPLHVGNVQHTCERLKRRTLRSGTYSVYGISLLIAMNTQLVMITSMTNKLKNVTGHVKDNAGELMHRNNTPAKICLVRTTS